MDSSSLLRFFPFLALAQTFTQYICNSIRNLAMQASDEAATVLCQ